MVAFNQTSMTLKSIGLQPFSSFKGKFAVLNKIKMTDVREGRNDKLNFERFSAFEFTMFNGINFKQNGNNVELNFIPVLVLMSKSFHVSILVHLYIYSFIYLFLNVFLYLFCKFKENEKKNQTIKYCINLLIRTQNK